MPYIVTVGLSVVLFLLGLYINIVLIKSLRKNIDSILDGAVAILIFGVASYNMIYLDWSYSEILCYIYPAVFIEGLISITCVIINQIKKNKKG